MRARKPHPSPPWPPAARGTRRPQRRGRSRSRRADSAKRRARTRRPPRCKCVRAGAPLHCQYLPWAPRARPGQQPLHRRIPCPRRAPWPPWQRPRPPRPAPRRPRGAVGGGLRAKPRGSQRPGRAPAPGEGRRLFSAGSHRRPQPHSARRSRSSWRSRGRGPLAAEGVAPAAGSGPSRCSGNCRTPSGRRPRSQTEGCATRDMRPATTRSQAVLHPPQRCAA
mmetsp:Transcript_63205/g.160406  ORF Transcript_63205/g.160406 Transcript_63205/m.160406 type:complete len:222 (-) Transcript_63205:407-1072(-)